MRSHGMTRTRLYRIWDAMRRRATRSHAKACYAGVTTCEEWQKFEPFMRWAMANGYDERLTLDRIDSTKGYAPENCRWATYETQNRNRKNVRLTIEDVRDMRRRYESGEMQKDIAKSYGILQSQVSVICANKRWREVAA